MKHLKRLLGWLRGLRRPTVDGEAIASSRELQRVFRARAYPRSRDRHYTVRLPRGYDDTIAYPLLMVLHGCHQDHHAIREITAFDDIADREGLIVVYPFVTGWTRTRSKNCWGWWEPGQIRPGAGEVEDLWQIVTQLCVELSIDPDRIHVTGLSSGAAMAVALAVAHCDEVASVVSVAGVAYGESPRAVAHVANRQPRYRLTHSTSLAMDAVMGERKRACPLLVVAAQDDRVVAPRAATNLRDAWAECFSIDLQRPVETHRGSSAGRAWRRERYLGNEDGAVVETLLVDSGGHAWMGGRPGPYSVPEGPPISEMAWSFLDMHPLPARRPMSAPPRRQPVLARWWRAAFQTSS